MNNLRVYTIRTTGFTENAPVLVKRSGKRFNSDTGAETARFYEPTQASMARLSKLVIDKIIEITYIDNNTGEMTLSRNSKYGYAPITYLHRNDIIGTGYSIDDISNDDLEGIAGAMGELYTGSGDYWLHLRSILDDEGVERVGKEE